MKDLRFEQFLIAIFLIGLLAVGVWIVKPFIKQTRRNADRIRYAKVIEQN